MSLFTDVANALHRAAANGHDVQQLLQQIDTVPLANRGPMTREETEALFARAADLIRRGGTEDAERLVNELEAAMLPRAVAGDVSIGFHAEIPAGEYRADSRLVQIYHPYYSVMFTNEGRFPFLFDCREARANVDFALNLTEVERMSLLSSIYVNERHGGHDVGRFPLGAFTGEAVDFRRVYEIARIYEIELRPLTDLRLTAPLRVAFMLGSWSRGEAASTPRRW